MLFRISTIAYILVLKFHLMDYCNRLNWFCISVKAGGMRIIQHKHGEPVKPEKPEPEEEEVYGAEPK